MHASIVCDRVLDLRKIELIHEIELNAVYDKGVKNSYVCYLLTNKKTLLLIIAKQGVDNFHKC